MTILRLNIIVNSLLLLILLLFDVALASQRQSDQVDNPQQLVRQLWSSNDDVRRTAKDDLIDLGPQAIQPLISLLEDILTNPSGRYMIGKEQEGLDAKRRYDHLFANDNEESKEARNRWIKLEITGRLKKDAMDILSALRAEEAVPVIIQLTWWEVEIVRLGYDLISPATQALIDMGAVAVPGLIESIETAEAIAPKLLYSCIGCTEEERRRRIGSCIGQIQIKALIALREIGEPSALPALDKLANTSDRERVRSYAQRAIQRVFEKIN